MHRKPNHVEGGPGFEWLTAMLRPVSHMNRSAVPIPNQANTDIQVVFVFLHLPYNKRMFLGYRLFLLNRFFSAWTRCCYHFFSLVLNIFLFCVFEGGIGGFQLVNKWRYSLESKSKMNNFTLIVFQSFACIFLLNKPYKVLTDLDLALGDNYWAVPWPIFICLYNFSFQTWAWVAESLPPMTASTLRLGRRFRSLRQDQRGRGWVRGRTAVAQVDPCTLVTGRLQVRYL